MKEYDAVMAHGYMFKYDPENKSLGIRNLMQDTAAAHLYHTGQAKRIFLPAGHYWGEDKPANGELMKEELMSLGVPEEAIIVKPEALDTGTEVELFNCEAKRRGWDNIASLSNATHTPRVRQNYRQKGLLMVHHIKAETVLGNIEHEGKRVFQSFLNKFSKSKSELIFK
jgi:uncharacterized SAM-binding protein YcdF (DUF218 family)